MKNYCYIFLMILVSACGTRQKLGPEAYVKHLNSDKSELLNTKELNGINYKLRLLTPEYMALIGSGGRITKPQFDNDLKNYVHQATFILVIEDSDINQNRVKSMVFNKESYGTILGYANSDMKNDFMMIREHDSLYCSILHMEPANSLQPVVRLSIAFTIPDSTLSDFTFTFNDNIFNNGPIKFNYSKKTMSDSPELKM